MMRSILGAVLVGFLLVGGQLPQAVGHASLVSSSPDDGALLDSPPSEVVLTFSERPLESTVNVVVRESNSNEVITSSAVETSGQKVRISWPADTPGGNYVVAYRVVSADGHPIDGTIDFSYTTEDSSVTTQSASPTSSPTPTPVETITESPAAAEESASSSSTGVTVAIILIGLAVGVVIGTVIYARAKRRV